ncbi:hypothetical protein [Streptomyces violascens]|uniref:hypothetical protein n=1 Tax=Streptomyces violascens TaxID=67381 RepID=UPI00369C17E6
MSERLKRLLVLSTACVALAGGAAVSSTGNAAAAPSSHTAVTADPHSGDGHRCYWEQGYWVWEWSYYYRQWMWVWYPAHWVCTY